MPASIKHLTDKKLNLTSLLALWKDGLYYTAAVVKCDKTNKKCLVCFEDGSEIWVRNRDVHIQLSLDQLNEDEDIVCCICDDGNSEAPNEIIICDVCQQGYHQKCHSPPVDASKIDESEDTNDHKDWFCATCSYILDQSNRAKVSVPAQASPHDKQAKQQLSQTKQASPSNSQQAKQPQQPTAAQPHQSPQKLESLPPTQSKSNPEPQKPASQPQPKAQPPQHHHQQQQQQQQPSSSQKQAAKVKQSPSPPQLQQQSKTTIGPIKSSISNVQKSAPYYPLSNQARAAASSSTAGIASLAASSALVVGSSSGRSKQDIVNQSQSRGSPRQKSSGVNVEVISQPVKHAVRKSSVNFVMPVRQSALPTATRSVLPTNIAPSTTPSSTVKTPTNLIATSIRTPITTSTKAATVSQSQPMIVTTSPGAKSYSGNNITTTTSAATTTTKSPETHGNRPQQTQAVTPVTTVINRHSSGSSPVIITTIGSGEKPNHNLISRSVVSSSITVTATRPDECNKTYMIVESIPKAPQSPSGTISTTNNGAQHTVVGTSSTQPTVIVNAGSKKIGPTNPSS